MSAENSIQLFQNQKIRMIWDAKQEERYFSIVDVVAVLTEQPDTRSAAKYWSVLKTRLKKEGSELTTNCSQLKMQASDGKFYKTDVATTEQLLRLIQSIPNKKAEPFKLWLAKVGSERLDETQDPELTINRAMREYQALGYSEDWINARLQSIRFRKELTNEWKRTGVNDELEYAILTNLMTKEWSGNSIQEYKHLKQLKKENLRDNMTSLELALNMLAEVSATVISKVEDPQGFEESVAPALSGAQVAGNARKDIEERTGTSAVSALNAKDQPGHLDVGNPVLLPEVIAP